MEAETAEFYPVLLYNTQKKESALTRKKESWKTAG
jgi:hypothetical protein